MRSQTALFPELISTESFIRTGPRTGPVPRLFPWIHRGEAAAKLGISLSCLTRILNGERRLSMEMANKMMVELGLGIDTLLQVEALRVERKRAREAWLAHLEHLKTLRLRRLRRARRR